MILSPKIWEIQMKSDRIIGGSACVYMRVHVCVCVCTCVYLYVYLHVSAYECVHTCPS